MFNPVDPVLGHNTSKERQPAAVPDLPNDHPYRPFKQRHAEDHTEQTEAASKKVIAEEQTGFRTGRGTTEQAAARPLPCLHRLQDGLRQGLACSFVGNHE